MNLAIDKLDEKVTIVCYEEVEVMTRREGLSKFFERMKNSEGPEHQRYESVFFQLLTGYNRCDDIIPFNRI